ncbi:MAG: bifunctional UDP-N-acetylglucosamine diphosphorylase/glucosamine-1-phosphate N-acetyltransferase GlmU [Candidatus Eremiobacteraeota bacterium]|nr:bifunctional UDP-N-acetylglucosamine diphosphorylase/glucosamine-1-phosphate N-acetyltransferase GlmU [Candidatus Eremiobacteraeota bacterium]MBC5827003.1 bifunctional UDP-N-acetylglucosamine diphosphorylase/glucosamine-1-phosphate N-acetyltransferase GlmU [Candidatus Eremiobacteraeota bacterium]
MSGSVAIVLAAGKGTRMKSRRPKVLHEVCGSSMLDHVLAALRASGVSDITAVVNPELRPAVEARGVETVVQDPQNGTGHAVALAMAARGGGSQPVLIVSADMPLLSSTLVAEVVATRGRDDADLALVTARVPLPTNFGRIVRAGQAIVKIVERADASPQEIEIDEVNAGVYCFDGRALLRHLRALRPNNAQGELYLTDCIAGIARDGGRISTVLWPDYRDVMGINTRIELAAAREEMQRRILDAHMLAGVTVIDPKGTYVDAGVSIEPDVTLFPQTHLRGTTAVATGCSVGPDTLIDDSALGRDVTVTYSVVKDTRIGSGVSVGPFAHLRAGTVVEEGAHVGNFVELKKTRMGRRSKAGHLAYLGDATLGENVNIGAGTITCNYDGEKKHPTSIGEGAFIGSNSSLVAPVSVGKGALVGAGAVVIRDVADRERVVGNPARQLVKKTISPEPE